MLLTLDLRRTLPVPKISDTTNDKHQHCTDDSNDDTRL